MNPPGMAWFAAPVAAPVTAPVSITADQLLAFLLQVGLLLGVALLLGRLARRLGMPAVVGELCAGVLLGPSLLAGLVPAFGDWLLPSGTSANPTPLVDAVAQLGVLLLVGLTGVGLDLTLLRRRGTAVLCGGAGGLVLPMAFGVAFGYAAPARLVPDGTGRGLFAAFLGVALCVSAVPVIARILLDMRLLHRDIGQLIVGTAAMSDAVGWLLLSGVSAMAVSDIRTGSGGATNGDESPLVALAHAVPVYGPALAVAVPLAALALTLTVGRRAVSALLRLSARLAEPHTHLGVVVLVVVFCAAGAHALGLEAIAGAFLGGVLVGSSPWLDRTRLAALHTVVLAVPAPLFFATAGLRMDLTALVEPLVLGCAVAVLALAVTGKLAGAYAGGRLGGLGHWDALALGAGLNARGVVEVVVATVGLRLGVLSVAMYTVIVLVAIATSLMAPPTLRYAVSRSPAMTARERAREVVLAETLGTAPTRAEPVAPVEVGSAAAVGSVAVDAEGRRA